MSLPTTIVDHIKSKIYDNNVKYLSETATTGAGVANSIVDKLDLGAGNKPASDQYYTSTRGPYLDELAAANLPADVDNVKLKTDLMNSASGSSTLNDANTSDTIVPGSLPTNIHVIFDISNLNNNGDDFDIEVKVGVAASERVVAYYNLTSDGTNITADKGSGVVSIIKQRRIDISDTLVYTGEQVIVELTKNSATDRNVTYKYICGV